MNITKKTLFSAVILTSSAAFTASTAYACPTCQVGDGGSFSNVSDTLNGTVDTLSGDTISDAATTLDVKATLKGTDVGSLTTSISDVANRNDTSNDNDIGGIGNGNNAGTGNTVDALSDSVNDIGNGNNAGNDNNVETLSDAAQANNVGNVNGASGTLKGYNTAQLNNAIKQLNRGSTNQPLKTKGDNKPL